MKMPPKSAQIIFADSVFFSPAKTKRAAGEMKPSRRAQTRRIYFLVRRLHYQTSPRPSMPHFNSA